MDFFHICSIAIILGVIIGVIFKILEFFEKKGAMKKMELNEKK